MDNSNQHHGMADLAADYFNQGFNCAESVMLAGKDILHLPELTSSAASGFGGGLGGKGLTCGALAGGIMVTGLYFNRISPEQKELYHTVLKKCRELTGAFQEEMGTTQCKDIINYDLTDSEQVHEFHQNQIREKKCAPVVYFAAGCLEKILTS